MLSKRHAEILRILNEEGSVAVSALATRLGVSLETVRRDVKPLTENGTVLKIHGAVGLAGQVGEAPFQRRMRENAQAKQRIARQLASTIRNGDSIMLDTGTTTSYVARELLGHRRLTVVTNSSDIARTLAAVNGNRVYMAGGELRSDSMAAFGVSAIEFIARFSVAHAIISAGAVGAAGIMDFDLEEAEFAGKMLSCGERKVVVTDQSKFGRQGLVTVCALDTIDELVTDAAPPKAIAGALRRAEVKLTIAADNKRPKTS